MPWAEMMAADEEAVFDRHKMAVELGVTIAMGSDCGGNESHRHGENARELECYVSCGMTPMQAITSATREGARVMRMADDIGTIEPGKLADIVVIDGDPLSDISLVRTAIVARSGRASSATFQLMDGWVNAWGGYCRLTRDPSGMARATKRKVSFRVRSRTRSCLADSCRS
jgi:cytosine/adenosine deaminase-related metal-dependent hydrolase